MHSCRGRTALVTSANQPLGREAVIALAYAGAQVVLHHHRSTHIRHVVEEACASAGRARSVAADLRSPAAAEMLATRTREIVGERLDNLVINGEAARAPLMEEATIEEFDLIVAAHVRAPFFLTRHLLPILHKGASIIVIAPVAGKEDASRAAGRLMVGLADYLASQLSGRGIRFNTILPADGGWHGPGAMQFAETVAFLASEDANGISGNVHHVGH
ncbi:SDR family NAD(P)-dependent oxidoreductase [Acuticoccus sediminis]|uniref:SDR family NAD(P)-dependent oxidoreductase n=1 Tax=Acuticoccus sediminis TaxID=2184697 RepID=UPI001390F8A4|nr:SDR family oxidoreductase [Acuticoccus sediminis]